MPDGGDSRRRWSGALAGCCSCWRRSPRRSALVAAAARLGWRARWDAPERPSQRRPAGSRRRRGRAALLGLAFPRYRTLAGLVARSGSGRPAALLQHLSALPAQLSLWVRPSALSLVHAPGDGWVPPLLGAALLAAGGAAAWRLRRRAPTFSFAVGWALLALVPTHTLLARRTP